jgi:tetratricopeptide (TPR) repeat protein
VPSSFFRLQNGTPFHIPFFLAAAAAATPLSTMAMEAKGEQLVHEVRGAGARPYCARTDTPQPATERPRTWPLSDPPPRSLLSSLLRAQAEQTLAKWTFFGGSDKYEDAADKFQRAGHAFKAAKACALSVGFGGGTRCFLCAVPRLALARQRPTTAPAAHALTCPARPSHSLPRRRVVGRQRLPEGRGELGAYPDIPPKWGSDPRASSHCTVAATLSRPSPPPPSPSPLSRVAQKKAKSDSDIASCYIESSRCFIKAGDSRTATELLETEALPRMVDAGRLSQAAKLHQEVAEMFEDEGQLDEAMNNYQKAADFFNAENAASTASKCLGKIALLAAQVREREERRMGRGAGRQRRPRRRRPPTLSIRSPPRTAASTSPLVPPHWQTDPPDFERAAGMFEQVGSDNLASNLLKFSAKSNFFNAVICTLARGDIVAADTSLNKYKDMDYTFGGATRTRRRDVACGGNLTLVVLSPRLPLPSPPSRRLARVQAPRGRLPGLQGRK